MKNTTVAVSTRQPRVGGYSFAKQGARRAKRRRDAQDRQFEYDSLTTEQKLARANKRQGKSKREVARLTAILASEQKAPKVVSPKASPAPVVQSAPLPDAPVKKAAKKTAKKKAAVKKKTEAK